ncbi:MAG: restriction endonuclease subunit S [Kiritimatiellae bacterium]|nr:restriction endonuclease subunit S [Kiritimatiellia bacterium]
MHKDFQPLGGKNGIADIVNGSTPSTDIAEYWDGDIFWATPTDMGKLSGLYLSDTARRITRAGFESCSTKLVPAGSVLLTSRAPVGNLSITTKDVAINQGMKGIVPKSGFDAHYILFYLMSKVKEMQADSHGNTFSELPKGKLEKMLIPIVPYDEQVKIGKHLQDKYKLSAKVTSAISNQSEAIASLESAVLRETYLWESGTVLPDGWEWKKLVQIADINPRRPNNLKHERFVSFLPMDAIDEVTGSISYLLTKPVEDVCNGYTYFNNDDVLFAKITPCMQNGKCCVAKGLLNGYGFGSTEFVVVRPHANIYTKWIFYYLRTTEFRRYAEDHFTGSAGQQRVPIDLIENTLVPVPKDVNKLITLTNFLDIRTSVCHKLISVNKKQMQGLDSLNLSILKEVFG